MAVKDPARRELIASKLRSFRAARKLNRADVAAAAGLKDSSTVSRHENGDTCMDYETAWDLADLYGVSLDELGGREWPPPAGDAV